MSNGYEFHYDAGHGWLKVDYASLAQAGLSRADFSGYSYVDDRHMYLEEDCDAGVFIERVKAMTGEMPIIAEIDDGNNSYIRAKRHNA